MSAVPSQQLRRGSQSFREAFAQWRTALRTEVGQVTSLPTAMFDATDPMLEMQLAGTTEEMLARLHRPSDRVAGLAAEHDRRLERVDEAELARLARRIAGRPPQPVDLLADLGTEFLTVLADACCSSPPPVQALAARHLCELFDITPANVDEVTAELTELAQEATAQRPPATDRFGPAVARVAAALRDHLAGSAMEQRR
jgi:hypothetical protein